MDLGMVVPIFVAATTLAEIFLVYFEVALLRDWLILNVMYIVQGSRGGAVPDLAFLGLTLFIFLLMIGYVRFCARLNWAT
jgi:hypothetical protein